MPAAHGNPGLYLMRPFNPQTRIIRLPREGEKSSGRGSPSMNLLHGMKLGMSRTLTRQVILFVCFLVGFLFLFFAIYFLG